MRPDIKQAFELIVKATGTIQANREVHVAIQEALKTIETELNPNMELNSSSKKVDKPSSLK